VSTYYYVYCGRCNEYAAFMGRWFPNRWGLMAGAEEELPVFMDRHGDHLEHVRIVSEHDLPLDAVRVDAG